MHVLEPFSGRPGREAAVRAAERRTLRARDAASRRSGRHEFTPAGS